MSSISTIVALCFASAVLGQGGRSFHSEVLINQDCNEEVLNGSTFLYGFADQPTYITGLQSDLCDIEFYLKDRRVVPNDTIVLLSGRNANLEFKFTNYLSEEKTISYCTIDGFEHLIEINLGSYQLSVLDIRAAREFEINTSPNCSDSIKVYFPYGGTVSGATLYCDSLSEDYIKAISYAYDHGRRYFTFSNSEAARYYVQFGACHWSKNFWLTLVTE